MLAVLNVAYPLAPVAPDTAGGAEHVLAQIDHALVAAGHRSLVIACEGSVVAGELIPVPHRAGRLTEEIRDAAQRAVRLAIDSVLRECRVDVVHLHGIDFHAYVPETETPVLATLHLPPEWYPREIFTGGRVHLHCVSRSQASRCPPFARLLETIPNGVDLDVYRPARRKRDYCVVLGRICPEKGIHHAIDAARLARMPIMVAGQVYRYEAHEQYFEREIKPRLGRHALFVGSISEGRKRRLMAGAQCVLIPSLAPETSSLVAMEAAACGTPVVAFASGALPEIVQHGETGFIVQETGAMADAIGSAGQISSARCREYAEARFDLRTTVQRYLDCYVSLSRRDPIGRLRSLESEWSALFERCPDAPPFLHPAWQIPWWEIFGSCPLKTIQVRRRGYLAGLAVCFEYQGRLVFAGNGISDRLGVLAADADAANELVDRLSRHQLDLQEIPSGSPLLRLRHEQCSVCPVLELSKPVPTPLARRLRQQRRYLVAQGEIRFEPGAPDMVDSLIRLHQEQWQTRGSPGVLTDSRIQCFHRRATRALANAGLLRVHSLRVAETLVGVLYGFARNATTYYYLSGFRPQFERFSPGSLLIEHAIETARLEGHTAFDFLRGAERYKYRWGAVDQPQFRIYS